MRAPGPSYLAPAVSRGLSILVVAFLVAAGVTPRPVAAASISSALVVAAEVLPHPAAQPGSSLQPLPTAGTETVVRGPDQAVVSSIPDALVSSTPIIEDVGIASIDNAQWPHIFRMSDGNEIAIYSDTNLGLAYTIKSGAAWGPPTALTGPWDQSHTAWTRNGDTLYGLTGPEYCPLPASLRLHKITYSGGTATDTVAIVATETSHPCILEGFGIYFDNPNNLVHVWYEQWDNPSDQLVAYNTNLLPQYSSSAVAPTNIFCTDRATSVNGDGGATFFLYSVPDCSSTGVLLNRVTATASSYSVAAETGVGTGAPTFLNRAASVWDGSKLVLIADDDFDGVFVNTRTAQDTYSGWINVASRPDPGSDGTFIRITAGAVGGSVYIGYSLFRTSTSGPDAGNASAQHRVLYYVARVNSVWSTPMFVAGLDSNDYDASAAASDQNDTGTWRFVYHAERCSSFSNCSYGPFVYEGSVATGTADFGAGSPYAYGACPTCAISADPVNLATGSFTSHADDLDIPGRILGLSFTRWYNSADPTPGPLGFAWTHSFNWTLTDNGTSAIVRRGDGRQDTFTRNQDGSYIGSPNVFDTLAKNVDNSFTLTLTSQIQYEFSTTGQLTRIHEPAGNQIGLAYASGNLTTITDTVGRQATLTYDASNRLIQLLDPLGRKVTYAYDGTGRLATVTDKIGNAAGQTPANHQWKYAYDGTSQHIATITDPDNRVRVTNTYDGQGRVTQQRDGLNALTTFAYTAGQTVVTDARAHPTTYTFDARMRLLTQVDTVGTNTYTVSYVYDAVGNRISGTDRNGKTTDFSYDTRGNLLTKTDPQVDPQTPRYLTQFSYDAKNNLIQVTDARGFVRTATFSATTNLPLSASGQIDGTTYAITKYEYADATNPGLVTRIIAPRGNLGPNPDYTFATTLSHDAQGNLTTRIDADGAKTTFAYDTVARLTSSVDPDGYAAGAIPADHTWTTAYDENDRQTRTVDPLGNALQYGYDGAGDRTSLTDRRGNVTTYAYDANTRLASVQQKPDPIGQPTLTYTTLIVRDAIGNSTRITQANGAVTDYAFDALNRMTSVTTHPDAQTSLVTSYVLDGNGQPTTRTAADNVATTYTYDALSRLTSVAAPALTTIGYTYDPLGDRIQMVDGTGTTLYQYDGLDRMTSAVAPNGALTYGYDRDGNRTTLGYPGSQNVSYVYSPGGRLSTVTDWASRVSSYTYQASGLVSTVNYPDGLRASDTYDRAQRLIQLTNAVGATTVTQETYTLDAEGNRTALDEFVSGITPPAAAWTPSVRVNDDTGVHASFVPTIALGPDGATYAAWDDGRDPSTHIYSSRRDPATGTWSANQRVNQLTGRCNQQANPSIAVDGSNNAYAVWIDYRNCGGNDIYFAKRPSSTGVWNTDVRVNDDHAGTGGKGNPNIALKSDGSAVAVWSDNRSNQLNIYSARLAAGASVWSANIRVTDNTTATKSAPKVVIAADGTAHAVWADSRNGNSDIYYAKLTPGASIWSANTKVSDDPGTAGQNSPQISIDSAGNLLVVWYDSRTSPQQIRMSRKLVGSSSWDASRVVSDASSQPYGAPILGVRSDGRAFVAWLDLRGSDVFAGLYTIYGSDYDPTTISWTTSTAVGDTRSQGNPGVAVNGSETQVSWSDDRTNDNDIRFSRRTTGAGVDHFVYAYDGLNRLASVTGPVAESFTFDAATNIASRTGPSATNTYDTSNRQTSDGTRSFTWSPADRLTQRGSDTFSYDALDRLVGSTVASTARTFAYNGDGLLKSASQGTTTNYLWDAATSPAALLQAGTDKVVYGLGPLYAVRADGTTYTFARDGLGSVRAELTDAGAVSKSYRYAAYGAVAQSFGGTPTLLGYAGQLTDSNGLVYLRARWFDTGTGRLMTRDPFGGTPGSPGSLNAYSYGGGAPTMNTDPSGNCSAPAGGFGYCIARFIPTEKLCTAPLLCGNGDNRLAPDAYGGGYRVQQLISANGVVSAGAGTSVASIGPFQVASPGRLEGSCEAAQNPSRIETYCTAWNGFAGLPGAPDQPIRTRVEISWVNGRPLVLAYGTFYPSLEVWYYGAGGPQLLYFYNAMAVGQEGLARVGYLANVVGNFAK